MKKKTVEKANSLLEEIKELEKYKALLDNRKYGENVHFKIKQHYGKTSGYEEVLIPVKHNKRLLVVVDEIISELDTALLEIKI